jgi:Sec-independent protein secretion pathway component TatC
MYVRTALRTALGSVDHDAQLSVVSHLDELRTRIIVALAVVGVAFGMCFWQNHQLLHLINAPLAHQTQQQVRDGRGPLGATYAVQRSARDTAVQLHTVVGLLAAVKFFQNFNSAQFNVLVQASQYYKFAATTLLAMGLLFQIPVAILVVTRAGVITPRQLRKNRRYAILACAAVAALLPGDAITMLLETVPLYLLFELSVIVAAIVERRSQLRAATAVPAPLE